jgi:SAM-dependent methyltransferase
MTRRDPVVEDMAGDTLNKLRAAGNYHRWILQLCGPYLGRRLLEVGCGIGTLTERFHTRGTVLAVDKDVRRLEELRARWPAPVPPLTAQWDVAEPVPDAVRAFRADTVVCVNILEHVAQDEQALRNFHDLLCPGGRLIVYVPALPGLFGSLDRELEHLRRYRKRDLLALGVRAGFRTEAAHYVNLPGVLGWWLNGRLLKRRLFSSRQVALFDRFVPLIAWWEERLPPCFGQSLFYVGRRP